MSDGQRDLRAQIAELQSQLAFQEDAISSLDAALAAQQQEILLLRRQIELLQGRQRELAAAQEEAHPPTPAQEKPPHY